MEDSPLYVNLHYDDESCCRKRSILLKRTESCGWNDIVRDFKEKVSITSQEPWAFEYYDDEGDCVMGKSEVEWKAAIRSARGKCEDGFILHVDAMPLGKSKFFAGFKATNEECCPSQLAKTKCCGNEAPKKCCPKEEYYCCENKKSGKECVFPCKRPIPEAPEYDPNEPPPIKYVNPLLSQYKYATQSLRAVALPLGAVGGGSIAIAGDGGLRQWQIVGKVMHDAHVPDSFFGIRVDQGQTSKAVVLQSNTWYDQTGFKPAAYITDHVVPQSSVQLLQTLPGVKTIEMTAKFPVVEVDYTSGEVPVNVHLEAFSPKTPLNSMTSGIPAIAFKFTVTNTSKQSATVSMLGSQQNIAGWNGQDTLVNEVEGSATYGGNINSLYTSTVMTIEEGSQEQVGSLVDIFGIDMTNPTLPADSQLNGQVAVAFVKEAGDECSVMLQYDKVKDMWDHFTGSGLPGQGSPGPSKPGRTWNGAVSVKRTLAAGESTVFTYLLAWYFPNRYRDWGLYTGLPKTKMYIGNHYNTLWKSAIDVVEYMTKNLTVLGSITYKFRDAMYNSTLPWQVIDSAAGRAGIPNTPTCFWSEDGNLYAFEGCSKSSGCCPLNCTHVWNYEMAIAKLWPDLERTMRQIDLFKQINPYGIIPSRTVAPLELQRVWELWYNYTPSPASCDICVDGEIGTVLKTYREIRQGASQQWFNNAWPPVKKIINRWLTELDDGTGLITGPQPNTYDVSIYGVTTFIGCLYLAALRAVEEMAKMQGDQTLADLCHSRFTIGSENLDRACFVNGKWYTQLVDPAHEVELLSDASFVDALYGQWWAHSLDLGWLLPKDHIVSSLKYTVERNYVEAFNPATQYPRKFCDERDSGYVIAKWDNGPPKNQLLYTNESSWSGMLYPFTGLMLYEGLHEEALNALRILRERYDGTRRSPWNEIECGDHYSRPMGGFLLFEIASGQTWSYVTDKAISLGFAPKLTPEKFRGFFILGTCWGQYAQTFDENGKNGQAELHVMYGELDLAELRIACNYKAAVVSIKNDIVPGLRVTLTKSGCLSLKFSSILTIGVDEILTVNLFG